MNLTKPKRQRNLSILLIPDDNADAISFRISFRLLKILFAVAIVIIIHIVSGGLFYYKYAVVDDKNWELNKENNQLKADNKKMYSLYEIVEGNQKYLDRVKTALGINRGSEGGSTIGAELLSTFTPPTVDIIGEPGVEYEQEGETQSKLDYLFLTNEKSNNSYHFFVRNIPTMLPVEGFLSTNFQDTDWFLPYRHLGIDISAQAGKEIKAAADGVILFANWTNDLGYLVIIDHLNGFVTYYGHNQVLLKRERSTVKKGDVIALLGNSGKSTGPHLHFEIWKDGVPVNPKEYLLTFQYK
jgi:murein DD-endopeptidase MepM/ murein hydrolase activator NlpD